ENPEGNRFHDELSKPLPLKGPSGRKSIPTRYFFNNELEYLKHGNQENKYALSLSKVKLQDQRFGYRYLKEIAVKRADHKEYMFTEADFPRLNQNDIKDLYLIKIQENIQNIDDVDEYDLINALLLYIRRIVIRNIVEDAQLGVESYQTKLNLTKPQFNIEGLYHKQLHTTISHPKGIVYLGKDNQKMLMRVDELHKFSDGTLNKVYQKLDVMLRDNVLGFGNEGLKDREWKRKEKYMKKSMLTKIEKSLKERQ
ncbi:hypothetical protein Tco_0709376, partial [Tanacetum coccineum]